MLLSAFCERGCITMHLVVVPLFRNGNVDSSISRKCHQRIVGSPTVTVPRFTDWKTRLKGKELREDWEPFSDTHSRPCFLPNNGRF